jgi:hypothetical protein
MFRLMLRLSPPIDTGRLLGCARAKEAVDVGENAVSAVRLEEGRCCGCCRCSWLGYAVETAEEPWAYEPEA